MNRTRVEEWSLLALAILTALTFLQAAGSPDIPIWLEWTRRCLRLGLVGGYADIQIDYPPLSLGILYGVALVSGEVGATLFFGLKCSLLLALLLTAFVYGRLSKSVTRATGLLAALIPCSVGLGYLDVYYAPLLLLAFHSLEQERWGRFGASFSAACLVKWQPLVLAPLCLVYLWKRGKRACSRALVAAAIPVVVLFVFFGFEMFRALGRALGHRPLSANALNLWWLVTHSLQALWPAAYGPLKAGMPYHLYAPPPGAGLPMLALRLPFLLAYAAVAFSLWRREPRFPVLVQHALVGFLAYFMLATGVHENHLFVVVLLGAVLALCGGGHRTLLVWTALFNVNLWVFYGASGRLPMSRVLGIDLAVPLAALGLWLFTLAFTALRDEPPG